MACEVTEEEQHCSEIESENPISNKAERVTVEEQHYGGSSRKSGKA
jgi:hypothetical protein